MRAWNPVVIGRPCNPQSQQAVSGHMLPFNRSWVLKLHSPKQRNLGGQSGSLASPVSCQFYWGFQSIYNFVFSQMQWILKSIRQPRPHHTSWSGQPVPFLWFAQVSNITGCHHHQAPTTTFLRPCHWRCGHANRTDCGLYIHVLAFATAFALEEIPSSCTITNE